MLQKKVLPGRKVEVTFRMPPMDDVVELYLCGDFSDWQANAVPLSQETDGTWGARLVLDAGKSYRFRYYDNQGSWLNDREADGFVANDFGSEDCVLDLTRMHEKAVHPSGNTAPKKPPARKARRGESKTVAVAPRTKAKR